MGAGLAALAVQSTLVTLLPIRDLLPDLVVIAILFVATADIERAARAATRAVRLAGGRVGADGAPAAVLADTPAARIARAADCPAPLPLDAEALVARVAR